MGERGKIAIINPNLSGFPTYQYNIQHAGVRTVLVPVNLIFQEKKGYIIFDNHADAA